MPISGSERSLVTIGCGYSDLPITARKIDFAESLGSVYMRPDMLLANKEWELLEVSEDNPIRCYFFTPT